MAPLKVSQNQEKQILLIDSFFVSTLNENISDFDELVDELIDWSCVFECYPLIETGYRLIKISHRFYYDRMPAEEAIKKSNNNCSSSVWTLEIRKQPFIRLLIQHVLVVFEPFEINKKMFKTIYSFESFFVSFKFDRFVWGSINLLCGNFQLEFP